MTDRLLRLRLESLERAHMRLRRQAIAGLVVIAVLLVTGAAPMRDATFDVVRAQRIDIREPDGTLRMTISNRARFPGAFQQGREIPHARPMAGMLFLDDEGTESGGLIFKGALGADGTPSSGLSLTFDRYQQDQQMQLLGVDEGGRHFAGLSFNDVVDGVARPVFSDADTKASQQGQPAITRRVYLGKNAARNATLQLADAAGKPRLELRVAPDGEASIVFLDAAGRPVRTLSADSGAATPPR